MKASIKKNIWNQRRRLLSRWVGLPRLPGRHICLFRLRPPLVTTGDGGGAITPRPSLPAPACAEGPAAVEIPSSAVTVNARFSRERRSLRAPHSLKCRSAVLPQEHVLACASLHRTSQRLIRFNRITPDTQLPHLCPHVFLRNPSGIPPLLTLLPRLLPRLLPLLRVGSSNL